MNESQKPRKTVNYWWYALPVVLAMIVGYAIQKDVSVVVVLPLLLFITALGVAFYLWKRDSAEDQRAEHD